MKKLFCFLAVAATAAFTSCSSDDDSGNNGENPGTGNEVTAITLTASATSVELGTAVTFTVVDQDGDAVTNATLAANGNAITSPWTAETAGEYTVVATLGTLTSSVTVTVNEVEVPADNKIHYNNEEFAITNTALVAWGGYNEDPNATEATHIIWSIITSDSNDILGILNGDVTPNSYMDIEFITPLTAEGEISFPTTENVTYLDIYEAYLNGAAVEFETSTEGTFVLNAPLTDQSTTTSFTLNGFLDSNALNLNYEGILEGFYAPQGRGINISSVNGRIAKANRTPIKVIMLK